MSVVLLKSESKNAHKGYRPTFYSVFRVKGRVMTLNLGVMVEGTPPASGYLGDKGDAAFERSKRKAEKMEDVKHEAARATVATEKAKAANPAIVDLADIYLERLGDRSPAHIALIRSAFKKFVDFCASPEAPDGTRGAKAQKILEINTDICTAFFRHVAGDYSFSTVKKWSNMLTGAFARLAPSVPNPFRGARLYAVGRVRTIRDAETGKVARLETGVHHRPLDRDQLRRLFDTAMGIDINLYNLAVTATATGLRISDCCTLLWESVHLDGDNPFVLVETTRKTGAKIAVPIFDCVTASPNYDPLLGEFRRVLETALAEADDNESFVFPKAARLYLQQRTDPETGRVYYPGRDRIYSAGKTLFAKALFADEPEEVEAEAEGVKPPSAQEVVEIIRATRWDEERKRRVIDIFTRHANGETYNAIKEATGYAKSTISYDLGAVEEITHTKLKARTAKSASVRELVKRTRKERTAGQRSASLYSWHSLRGSFVVLMRDTGLDLDTIRELVGHTTASMTLEYYNPTVKQAAEKARAARRRWNHQQAALNAPAVRPLLEADNHRLPTANAASPEFEALREAVKNLTPEQRAALLAP